MTEKTDNHAVHVPAGGVRFPRVRYSILYLTQWEDSLLAIGGLVAAISTDVTPAVYGLVVGGLALAGLGKSLPSIAAQLGLRPESPFPQDSERRYVAFPTGNSVRDPVTLGGDSALLVATLLGLAFYLRSPTHLPWFMICIGAGFVLKAGADLLELGFLARALDAVPLHATSKSTSNPDPEPKPSASLGSATTESVIFGALGAGTLALFLFHPTSTEPAATLSLGLAALAKAAPSFISAASASSGKSD